MNKGRIQKILVVGNSVSLSPREDVPGYVDLLESDGRWSIAKMICRGATIGAMEADVTAYLSKEKPDAMILQVGIVECAPRPLNERERQWLSHLKYPRIKNLIIRLIHIFRRRIIHSRGLNQRMQLVAFQECVSRILKIYPGFVAMLPMPYVPSLLERRSPGFNRQIELYNTVLKAEAGANKEYLDIFLGTPLDDLYDDVNGIHLNGATHRLIADAIRVWLSMPDSQNSVGYARDLLKLQEGSKL